ncbi:DUF4382 domain-containing protein [Paludibacter jiangxiensis]|uniref:DUF4382 domain-containing protein n=1 Tax=Paludibacter jiangxiensis TaxID=681398 RepID=A0A171AHE2_9BACT|nr:DUF4382 domain-containing protein [Paludibacter jiangxiensis]GAT63731.1 hypothetical protein PJIAN_4272 [Paludibacter jiangxiensis]
MNKKIIAAIFVAGTLALGLASCTTDPVKNATFSVRLTDAPANFQQVLIDIQSAQINVAATGVTDNWVSLPIRSGVYNLLDFRNGMDTLLAKIELPAGQITQMRLVLGSNNQVKINDQLYTLDTPSAMQSGLKFNINAILTEGIDYQLWIDFDAARSIVAKGNGGFNLKPVIRTFTKATSGAIKGMVSPVAAAPYVTAIAGGDTIGTIAGSDGKFLLRGIDAGTYKVVFQPVSPYTNKTVDNVLVTSGQVTDMGTVALQ